MQSNDLLHHHLSQPRLRHLAQHAGPDPQQRRRASGRRIPQDAAEPRHLDRPDRRHGDHGARTAAPERHALRRARPRRSEMDRRAADRPDAGAPDPDQPPDRRDAAGHPAVPAVRAVLDILPSPQRGAFTKEDGEAVIDAEGRACPSRRLTLPNVDSDAVRSARRRRAWSAATPSTHAPRFLHALRVAARALVQPASDAGSRAPAASDGRRGPHLRSARPAACPTARRTTIPKVRGAARAGAVGRRHGLVLARAPRRDDRHHEGADRLDSAGARRGAADAGQDAGGDAGLGRLAVLQRGQSAARARPLDAHAHHPEPVLGGQGLPRVRRRRPHEALVVLRPRGRRDGRAGQVHAAHARRRALPGGPLQRAQGKCRGAVPGAFNHRCAHLRWRLEAIARPPVSGAAPAPTTPAAPRPRASADPARSGESAPR